MRRPLTVACAQPLSVPGRLDANVSRHVESIAMAAVHSGAHLVVFPELSLTGYDLDATALRPDDAALLPLRQACRELDVVALVGAPIAADEDGNESIGTLMVDGAGASTVYRKMWPGADETVRFTAGSSLGIVDVDGWMIGLAICRDTGIDEHVEALADADVDAVAASVVDRPDSHDEQRRRARVIAARVGVPVAVASGAGAQASGFDITAGRSFIVDALGKVIAETQSSPATIATATLDP